MKVSRGLICQRGLTHRCPNCGAATLYKPGKLFELNRSCSQCGFGLDTDEGAFLGAFALNYGVTAFGVLIPVVATCFFMGVSVVNIVITAVTISIIVPLILYRASRSWWVMVDALFDAEHLPANLADKPKKSP
jgi:uncharacterized protein (DUF983 family)